MLMTPIITINGVRPNDQLLKIQAPLKGTKGLNQLKFSAVEL